MRLCPHLPNRSTAPSGPWPPRYRGFTITDTPHSVGLPGRVIGRSQKPLPDNKQTLQETDIHDPGRIRTHNPSKRAVAIPCLRPPGPRDLQS